jgi:hypothetical protein
MFHLDVPPNYAHFKPLPSAHELLKTHITKSSCRKEWVFLEIRVRVYVSVHNTDCIYPQPLQTSNSISFHTSWNIKPA